MLDFNSFQRELIKRDIPKPLAYMFTYVYEAITELNEQLDEMAKLAVQLAEALQHFTQLNDATMKRIVKVERRGQTEGVDIRSEAISEDPDQGSLL